MTAADVKRVLPEFNTHEEREVSARVVSRSDAAVGADPPSFFMCLHKRVAALIKGRNLFFLP